MTDAPRRSDLGYSDLGYARPDVDREQRMGVPEVVYGPGKSTEQVVGVVRTLLAANAGPVLVTRLEAGAAAEVGAAVADGVYDVDARLLVWRPAPPRAFRVVVVSAGTSDAPVAAEAAVVATAVGLDVHRLRDVGVAGLHRLLAETAELDGADAVICVAGMEGALPSVVGGLVGCPVIAVPTSVGYGAALEGVTALLGMLTSCAAGVVVVNIDNGFGAAMAAHRMARAARR
ncbi:MAG: nickel pincer cofactor biosynthesis protein LarB [Pseudonocardia sp.]|nr:nickel pincer cofactor biosynthesis protein LarB [Pseudonocardia sp.]